MNKKKLKNKSKYIVLLDWFDGFTSFVDDAHRSFCNIIVLILIWMIYVGEELNNILPK